LRARQKRSSPQAWGAEWRGWRVPSQCSCLHLSLDLRDTGRAMSQENVEPFRKVLDAFNQRELGSFLTLMDDDVEANSRLAPMEGGYHGHEGICRWWENLLDAFPDFTIEVVEVRNFGEATLGILRNRGHGGGSDTPLKESLWLVAWWRRGKCIRWDTCQTAAEALEVAGLQE
jgi:SnoaL-like domain